MKLDDAFLRASLHPPTGEWRSEPGLRDSAVLAVIVARDGEDRLVFNRRRDDLPFHAGQICLPGGAREGAEDAVACAVRETCEEMGVAPASLDVLGRLPDRVSIAGFKVAAFVARLSGAARFAPRAEEVAEVFEVPCAAFADEARWGFTETSHPLARFSKVPCFAYEGRLVWGLTGILVRDFADAVVNPIARGTPRSPPRSP
jgi:8-oxo-dGTP pyrophosphatase MutT (NUDIX family)